MSRERRKLTPLQRLLRRSRGATLLAALALLALLRTDRLVEAALPGDLAPLVPPEPLVLLESEDLPALVGRWRECRLRRDVEATDVYSRCQASRLTLRLGERMDMLDAVFSRPASLENIAALPGDRGGLALYNVGDTAFVMWLRTHHGAGEQLALLRPDLEVERSRRGDHEYLIHRGDDESSAIGYAVVGDLLIISNDLERFEQALALAAGESGPSLAADTTYMALARRAPASAEAHIYLDMRRLLTTRQFRRYWVHNNSDELGSLERALLSVTWGEDQTVENRLLAYRSDSTERLPAGSAGGVPADERLAALPPGTYAAVRAIDAEAGALAARWIWPGAAEEDGAESIAALRELLARGRASQLVEVIRPALGRDGFAPRDQLAVAFLLGEPAAFLTPEVVEAGARALSRSVEGGDRIEPTGRRSHARGVTVQTIAPLVPGMAGLSVARSRDGEVLVLSNNTALAAEVASGAAPAAALGRVLRAGGPDVAQVDFTGARRALSRRLRLISTSGDRERHGIAGFFGDAVPELLRVPRLTRIQRVAVRDGDFDRHEVRYLP